MTHTREQLAELTARLRARRGRLAAEAADVLDGLARLIPPMDDRPNAGRPTYSEVMLFATMADDPTLRDIIADVLAELERQNRYGFAEADPATFSTDGRGTLALAAGAYANIAGRNLRGNHNARDIVRPPWWPWATGYYQPHHDDPERDLLQAVALLLAQLRITRRASTGDTTEGTPE